MAGTVFYIRDLPCITFSRIFGMKCIQYFTYFGSNIIIVTFVTSTDIVDFTCFTRMVYKVYAFTVVENIKPVTYIFPVSINRNRFIIERFSDNCRNQFFIMLFRAVIVGSVGNDCIHPVGMQITSDDHIAGSL
jgi:hypothetical protein